MYKKHDRNQTLLEDFVMPFGGKLLADNRWVKTAAIMPWDFIEDIYTDTMCLDNGAGAINARIAFGALYIKEAENLTDDRTVEHIAENAYMQYFLGLQEFRQAPLFHPSMMTHFRKRFPASMVEEINRRMFVGEKKLEGDAVQSNDDDDDDNNHNGDVPPTKGKLVLDATVAPADVRYPSDLSLLDEARENTEKIIEELWAHSKRKGHKTRYNRKKARAQYLRIAKQKRPKAKKTRAVIRKQLAYIKRNLEQIGDLLLETGMDILPEKRLSRIMTICEVYRQQLQMYHSKSHTHEERIVSLRQPHVRPIVRGKAGRRFEFGQKLAFSVVDGYTFIENQSFDNFNEGISLIESAKRYKQRYGCYPEVIQADQIYRNRENLAFCKKWGIRLSGPKLGRPRKNDQRDRDVEYQDRCERNIVEGRNGMAKRRFGLDRILSWLPETSMTEAAMQVLCMNVRIRLLLQRYFPNLRFLRLALRFVSLC